MGNTGSSNFSGTRKVSHRNTRGRNVKNNNYEVVENSLDTKKSLTASAEFVPSSQSVNNNNNNNRVRRAHPHQSNRTRKVKKSTRGGRRINVEDNNNDDEIDDSI